MNSNVTSILNSIKEFLDISPEDTCFDSVLIMNINMIFLDLILLGIGPTTGFRINGENETWNDYIPNGPDTAMLDPIKNYIGLKVKLVFDPPTNSIHKQAIMDSISKLEFSLKMYNEHIKTML